MSHRVVKLAEVRYALPIPGDINSFNPKCNSFKIEDKLSLDIEKLVTYAQVILLRLQGFVLQAMVCA
jgi:hypothetical protein